jgi:16S rRNA (cytosine967-C5)-methyltransferase
MDSDAPRALALAALGWEWRVTPDTIAAWCEEPHGPGRSQEAERARLEAEPPAGLPAWVEGNYPEWLAGSFERAFGEDAIAEGAGLSRRAPVDLRVNTLKATRDKVLKALARAGAQAGPWSPFAVRIPHSVRDGRTPNVEAEPAHASGWFEVQDAGSQVAALMTAAQPGQQVVDFCAGAGGKTLALAALMANRGQIHAYDADRHRLRPIFERLKRAGVRNVQVIPADEPQRLEALKAGADVVLVDAPCSGSGSWRRRPDAKWRLTPEALERRIAEQKKALDQARRW